VPEYGNLGKLRMQPDGRLKGALEYPLDRSTKIEVRKVTVEEIPQDRLTQKDIEWGNTHRVFYTMHTKEEDQQYYSEKGGNDQSVNKPPKGDDIPF
tara:strand:+ start:391 stop:678 length:288 start_codon:yes stop_codon:yes gene_type:complete